MTNSQETKTKFYFNFKLTLWLKAAFFVKLTELFFKIGRTFFIVLAGKQFRDLVTLRPIEAQ
jgi:hypothetical protein